VPEKVEGAGVATEIQGGMGAVPEGNDQTTATTTTTTTTGHTIADQDSVLAGQVGRQRNIISVSSSSAATFSWPPSCLDSDRDHHVITPMSSHGVIAVIINRPGAPLKGSTCRRQGKDHEAAPTDKDATAADASDVTEDAWTWGKDEEASPRRD
jgi:hypothetical protein